MKNLLSINDLKVSFFTDVGEVKAVRGVSLQMNPGESLGIVGESGCGKSVTSLAIMSLLQSPGKVVGGEIFFEGEDLLKKTGKQMRKIRGNRISMIFQDPMTSLNPVYTIGNQLEEVIKEHSASMGKDQIHKRCLELLTLVGIPSPELRLKQYAHEFSGGMRQRAMIAIGLANNPLLLIADEPTTALDVTIQAQILKLMKDLRSKVATSIILITHDLGVVADVCDNIKVMYAGLIAEEGTTRNLFYNPAHPYTWGLLKSIPKVTAGSRTRLLPIEGQPPDLIKPPIGCAFADRCPYCMIVCKQQQPPFFAVSDDHRVTCYLHHELAKERLAAIKAEGGIPNVK